MNHKTELVFAGYIKIEEESTISSNNGTFSKVPKKLLKRFKHPDCPNKYYYVSDYGAKKKERNEILQNFYDHYLDMFKKKTISILCLILNVEKINNISEYIRYFKYKKLPKMGIRASSHIRINDIGEKYKKPHCHVFIVTQYIEDNIIKELFCKKISQKFKLIPMDDTFGLIQYCQKKELYVKGKGKSWSRSPLFLEPRKLIKIDPNSIS